MLKLAIYAGIAGILSGTAATFALRSTPADAAGWWQIVIAVAGLPILLYELEKVAKDLRRAEWKPDISIGLAYFRESLLELKDYEGEFPVDIDLTSEHRTSGKPEYICLLVVQNRGKLAAKFVRILIELKSPEDDFSFIPSEELKLIGAQDYSFEASSNWFIHPKHARVFPLTFSTSEPQQYLFHCTVWTEGLEKPVGQALTVRIVDKYGQEERQKELQEMVDGIERILGPGPEESLD
jgi:hypothetical protein